MLRLRFYGFAPTLHVIGCWGIREREVTPHTNSAPLHMLLFVMILQGAWSRSHCILHAGCTNMSQAHVQNINREKKPRP